MCFFIALITSLLFGNAVGKKHRDFPLIIPVSVAEVGFQIALFKHSPKDDPAGPKDVEKEAVSCNFRASPDEENAEKVERVTYPTIRSTNQQRE